MDLLVSGPERAPLAARAAGWRPPRRLVLAVALAALATAGGAWVALDEVRTAAARPDVDVVEAASVVTVRPRGRDGELLLTLLNEGGDVRLVAAALDVPGVSGALPRLDVALAPGGPVEVALPFSARACPVRGPRGDVVLSLRGASGTLTRRVPLDSAGPLRPTLLAAGCVTHRDDAAVALSLRGAGGQAYRDGPVVRGTAVVDVRNLGADVDVVRLRAEVPGAVFWPSSTSGVAPGETPRLTLPFQVADCAELRRTGRVVVTVVDDAVGTRELGFRATEDEEARTVRDVDLEVVHRACETTLRR